MILRHYITAIYVNHGNNVCDSEICQADITTIKIIFLGSKMTLMSMLFFINHYPSMRNT